MQFFHCCWVLLLCFKRSLVVSDINSHKFKMQLQLSKLRRSVGECSCNCDTMQVAHGFKLWL
ncbi:hypothetical protein GLYMA_08G232050v4 [Glycine max]|nr:hypothetical protein GLYMA_08G232050v4 [Glycine max]KAH1052694.1 hypothetical protein GYH30_022145 [Glycine max]